MAIAVSGWTLKEVIALKVSVAEIRTKLAMPTVATIVPQLNKQNQNANHN